MSPNIKDIIKVAVPVVMAIVSYLMQVDPLDLCVPKPPVATQGAE